MHIGIIAVSPEGSSLCYRLIMSKAATRCAPERQPTVSMHSLPFSRYMAAIEQNNWTAIGEMLVESAKALARAGAKVCVLPDNVAAHASSLAENASPIPWMSMVDLVADAVANDHRRTVGLLGVKQVTFGSTYQAALGMRGVTVLVPEEREADDVDRIIFEELVHGRCSQPSRERVMGILGTLQQRGCEGVIVGCTELPLLFTSDPTPLPLYDSVDHLAEAAVAAAINATDD
ncbi:MAG: amino acid racemase [Phycisphaerales bacterium]|nr:MAG: amino acid racemase [Phycisphaerales bacterium]